MRVAETEADASPAGLSSASPVFGQMSRVTTPNLKLRGTTPGFFMGLSIFSLNQIAIMLASISLKARPAEKYSANPVVFGVFKSSGHIYQRQNAWTSTS
jgi:hypothetical protein